MPELLYHLKCKEKSAHATALAFGDPQRCELVKPFLDSYTLLSSNRGFVVYNGYFRSAPFTFSALGIGGPSWCIGLHELALAGSSLFIRVGTAGIVNSTVKTGDLVIPTEAISDEGASSYVLGKGRSLRPDRSLLEAITFSANEQGFSYHYGSVHSKDFLYMEEPEGYPQAPFLKRRMNDVEDMGVLVTEMECAALFAFGAARKYRTAAILAAIDENQEGSVETQKKALAVALGTLKYLSQEGLYA